MTTIKQEEQLNYLCAQVHEIGARARRTETNLHKVREHLGIDTDSRVIVRDSGTVVSNGHDVTLSQIKRALEARNVFEPTFAVSVHAGGEAIAVVTFLR